MTSVRNPVFKQHIPLILIVVLAIINYHAATTRVHVGDFQSIEPIAYPPPYRFTTELYLYDPVTDRAWIYVFNGFAVSTDLIGSGYEVLSIYSSGLDAFILLSSIMVMLIYYFSLKHLFDKGFYKAHLLVFILLVSAIVFNHLYLLTVEQPVSRADVIELKKPLYCERLEEKHVCIIDSFNKSSIIYLEINQTVDLLIVKNNVLEEKNNTRKYLDYVETNKNVRIGIVTSDPDTPLIYRRIVFNRLRNPYTPLYYVVASIISSIASIMLVAGRR